MRKTMDTERLAELAGDLYDAMTTAKRDNGEAFVRLKDGAPEWMEDVIRDAHGTEMSPDDWRYAEIRDAAGTLHDCDGDVESAAAGVEADAYNTDRLKWLASDLERPAICDEAATELGWEFDGKGNDTMALIGLGQWYERSGILHRLAEALEEYGPDAE